MPGLHEPLPTSRLFVQNLGAFLAISVPLAALVIGAENAQATGVLLAESYRPPVNAMTIISGIGGILAGLLGVKWTPKFGPGAKL